jgi:serine/threonine-protein kinase
VRTPDLVGRSEAEARRLADRRGLQLEIEYVESDGRPGRVLDQLPDRGVEVPAGTTVAVMVATRAETVVVPDVHGLSETAAIAQLEAAGLQPGQRRSADDRLPEGYVVSTDPRAGVSMTRDAVVDYAISTGRGAWPEPDGSAPASAAGASPALLSVASTAPSAPATGAPGAPESATPEVTAAATPLPPGSAGPTSPPTAPVPTASALAEASPPSSPSAAPSVEAAATAPTGSDVPGSSPGPRPSAGQSPPLPPGGSPSPLPSVDLVLVGDFRCLDLATARAHIEEAGLLVGATIPADPPPGDDWLVQEQLPQAGEYLARGSNVDLVLADAMEPCPPG